jgi:hydroxymethylglutaryl-CoA lyase
MSDLVRITDVSPRDGLQNEPGVIPTEDKVKLVELLCKTGVDEIEVTSFVSAKWVPQLGDAKEVVLGIAALLQQRRTGGVKDFIALVPNQIGFDGLLEVESQAVLQFGGVDSWNPPVVGTIAFFTAASETFNRKNTNASIAESLTKFRDIIRSNEAVLLGCRAYVSCVIACPFEGPVAPTRVADVAASLIDLGVVDEIDLGDTIGAATPESTVLMLEAVRSRIGNGWFERGAVTLHLHDTFGRAAECVRAALDLGVRSFDGSVAGLGGCPYASKTLPDGTIQQAPGNIATDLLVRTIHEAGYRTNVDLNALADAAAFAREIVAKSRATSDRSGS